MEKLLISDAAKQVEVETHVLRYWEEELHLPIERNKQGHRFYTAEDVDRFRQIKRMKEQGFQLKAIRNALDAAQDGKAAPDMPRLPEPDKLLNAGKTGEMERKEREKGEKEKKDAGKKEAGRKEDMKKEAVKKTDVHNVKGKQTMQVTISSADQEVSIQTKEEELQDRRAEKAARLQFLLHHMISEAVRENNEQLSEDIRRTVVKELDYQFRLKEEKEEEREKERMKREDEHFKKIDELLRSKAVKENRKKHSLF